MIGKAGDTIRYLQYNSGAKIQIMRDADADPHSAIRPVELIGTAESINKAEKLINDVIAEVSLVLCLHLYNACSNSSIACDFVNIVNININIYLISGRCWRFSFPGG